MCSQDNTDSFGAPRQGGLSQLLGRNAPPVVPAAPPQATGLASLFQPSARGPVAAPEATGLASLFRPSARAPAAPVSVTPQARGPRNRRGLER